MQGNHGRRKKPGKAAGLFSARSRHFPLAFARAAREAGRMKQLKCLGTCCIIIAVCVYIGTAGGVLIGAVYSYRTTQGVPGHGAGIILAGCAMLGGNAGAKIGLIAGLLLAVAHTIIATNKRPG
jgi:hypothetical protein